MPIDSSKPEIVHGTSVALPSQKGLLIVGASGSGKSSLALMMMGFGAQLVSDDQTELSFDPETQQVLATAPSAIRNKIEARGIGILNALALGQCRLCAVVDLGLPQDQRLPPLRIRRLLGCDLPLIHHGDGPAFAAALVQFLKEGRNV
jgi:HPr kinase/phosphorylase